MSLFVVSFLYCKSGESFCKFSDGVTLCLSASGQSFCMVNKHRTKNIHSSYYPTSKTIKYLQMSVKIRNMFPINPIQEKSWKVSFKTEYELKRVEFSFPAHETNLKTIHYNIKSIDGMVTIYINENEKLAKVRYPVLVGSEVELPKGSEGSARRIFKYAFMTQLLFLKDIHSSCPWNKILRAFFRNVIQISQCRSSNQNKLKFHKKLQIIFPLGFHLI
eukprot:UN29344